MNMSHEIFVTNLGCSSVLASVLNSGSTAMPPTPVGRLDGFSPFPIMLGSIVCEPWLRSGTVGSTFTSGWVESLEQNCLS